MATVVGIDIGSQKTMIVGDDGEIVRTDTGSISWSTLIAFLGRSRLIGEEALPQITGDNTIAMINSFIGRSFDDIKTMEIARHLRCKLSQTESKIASFNFLYNDEIKSFDTTSLLAMFITILVNRIHEIGLNDSKITFTLPPNTSYPIKYGIIQACDISGIDLSRVYTIESHECLVKTYGRKISAIRDPEKQGFEVSL